MEKIDVDNTNSKGIQRLLDKHRYGEALFRVKEILKKEPTNGELHYILAFCLVKSVMDPYKALEHYNLALKYGYNEFRVLKHRGSLYYKLGHFSSAVADFRNALYLYPLDEDLRQSLQRVTYKPIDNQDKIELHSPVIVSTVPKSGTVLLKNMLLSILGDRLLVRYLATNEFLQSLPRLRNVIYFGHIWYSEQMAEKMSSLPKIILIRDPRDNVVSHAHFLNHNTEEYWTIDQYQKYWNNKKWDEKLSSVIFGMSTPNNYPTSILNAYLNYALKWVGPNTLVIRYEDIVGSKFGGSDAKVIRTIESMIEFIGIKNIDQDVLEKKIHSGADPTKSNTFRSGKVGTWVEEFKSSHVRQMKVAARGLVSVLGYERNENWDISQQTAESGPDLENPIAVGRDHFLPRIDSQSLIEFRSRRKKLDWNEYIQMSEAFAGSSQLTSIIDEWALNVFIEMDQPEQAVDLLESLLQISPSNPRWNYYYAFSLHRLKRDPHKALRYYDIALEKGFEEYWVRYNRGLLFKELGDFENASVDLQQTLTLNPHNNVAHKVLRDIECTYSKDRLSDLSEVQELVSGLQYQRASIKLENMLKRFPNNAQLNYLYAFCLHVLKKDLHKALSCYNIALKNGFDEFWVKYNRGILFFNLGKSEYAVADLERASTLKPDHGGPELILRQIKLAKEYHADNK